MAILVEQMSREGFEPTVGKPPVLAREVKGKLHDPFERLTKPPAPTASARTPCGGHVCEKVSRGRLIGATAAQG